MDERDGDVGDSLVNEGGTVTLTDFAYLNGLPAPSGLSCGHRLSSICWQNSM